MTYKELYYGMKIFKGFFEIGSGLKKKVKKLYNASAKEDILLIQEKVFNGEYTFGQQIKTEGFLSKYSYLYKPASHSNVFATGTEKLGFKIEKGKKVWDYQISMKHSQFPIQRLNSFQDSNGEYQVHFIYPRSFNSFVLSHCDLDSDTNYYLDVSDSNKPIIVLIDPQKTKLTVENYVELKGIIKDIPVELFNIFQDVNDPFVHKVLSNTFRQFSEVGGFCIDCRNIEDTEIEKIDSIENLNALIFLEGNISNTNKLIDSNIFRKCIPTTMIAEHLTKVNMNGSNALSYPIPGSVVLNSSINENSFSFYVETDLKNQQQLQSDLNLMRSKYVRLTKNLNTKHKKSHLKFSANFGFDPKRVKAMTKVNYLESKQLIKLEEQDEKYQKVIKWLKE